MVPFGERAGTEILGFLSPAKILALLSGIALYYDGTLRSFVASRNSGQRWILRGASVLAASVAVFLPLSTRPAQILAIQSLLAQVALLLVFAAAWSRASKAERSATAYATAVGLLISIVASGAAGTPISEEPGAPTRLSAFLLNPNIFGGVCLLALGMVLLQQRATPAGGTQRTLNLLLISSLTAALAATLSRGAILGLGVFSTSLLSSRFSKRRTVRVAYLLAIPFAIMASAVFASSHLSTAGFSGQLRSRIEGAVGRESGPDNAIQERQELLRLSVQAFARSPIAGHGPASYQRTLGTAESQHNIYAGVAVESGAVGLIGLAMLLVGVVITLTGASHRGQEEVAAALALSFLVFGATSNLLTDQQFWLAQALALATVAATRRREA
jgi:hypothetical protein